MGRPVRLGHAPGGFPDGFAATDRQHVGGGDHPERRGPRVGGDDVRDEIAESFEVSQPTISRAVAAVTPLLARVLAECVPVAEDLDPRTQYIVDGTLLPCWSWRGQRQLYSGKHKATGLNVQVAGDLDGRVAWISGPV